MTKEESEKYIDIVKNENMDDMFDFGYKLGIKAGSLAESSEEGERVCVKCGKKYEPHTHVECYCSGRSECHVCGWHGAPYGELSKCPNFECV